MSTEIKKHLSKLSISISPDKVKQFNKMVLQFELKGEHPLTLNGQMFGVHKFVFTSEDRRLLFDIAGVTEQEVTEQIAEISVIDKSFKVISDPFNVLSVYLTHLVLGSKLSNKLKEETSINLLNYLQYRFMCSAVNHSFPYKANHDIMQTVIESLNLKFAIKQFGSWKDVIINRSEAVINDRKLRKSLEKFDDDKTVLYVITDTSTKIRSQLRLITSEYHNVKETNQFIRSHSSTTELDGEKILRERDGSFDLMSSTVFHRVMNKQAFIDDNYIKMVQRSVPRLNKSIIKRALTALTDEAQIQSSEGRLKKVVNKRAGGKIYEGVEILTQKIIQVIYTNAILHDRVNIKSKIAVYKFAQNLFTASRMTDEDVVDTKNSITDFVHRQRITKRETTTSGLVIAIALYLCLLSFNT